MSPHPGEGCEAVYIDGKPVSVDSSIAPIVRALNAVGLKTRESCSGHGYKPGRISLYDGRELIIASNYEEAQRLLS